MDRAEGKITKLNTGKLRKSLPTGFRNIWRILTISRSKTGGFSPNLQVFKVSEKYKDQKKNKNKNKKQQQQQKKFKGNKMQGMEEIVLKSYYNYVFREGRVDAGFMKEQNGK